MGTDRLTLLDLAKVSDPSGMLADIAEILQESNPILQDAPMLPSNAPLGHSVTVRKSLPTVAFRKMNQGVVRSKGSATQKTETMGMLEGRGEVDSRMQDFVLDFNAKRESEDAGFLEAMSQTMASTFFYGDESTLESSFTGLQPRLQTAATAITGSQVAKHTASPSGSDYTSLYFVDWGARGAHGIYPKAKGKAGLEKKDLGEIDVNDPDGNPFRAFAAWYKWYCGLAVEDARHVARLANVDIDQTQAETAGELVKSIVKILNAMASRNGMQRVIYCRHEILTAFWLQVMAKSNLAISIQEYLGELTPHVWGVPLRRCDQISAAESVIS